jgi:hypothetical protein
MILKRSTGKLFFCLLLGGLISVHNARSQDDFTDDLEAELEAEIGLSEEDLSSSSAEDFDDFDESSSSDSGEASESSSSDVADEVTVEGFDDEEFSEEDFEDEFAEEDAASESFSDEDFGGEDFGEEDFGDEDFAEEDFSEEDFGDEAFDEFAEETPAADETVPIDENFGDTEMTEDPPMEMSDGPVQDDFQPIEEQPAFDQSPPAEDFGDISAGPTEPNLEYEAKLYDIYVNHHSTPTPNLEWQSLVGERRSEIYSISTGDTLWGISETFFGDGNYWPKVWSLNSTIKNPHLIQPSNQIAFVMGTETDAPMFTVTEPEATEQTEEGADAMVEGSAQKPVPERLSEQDIEDLIEAGALSAQDTEQLQEMIEQDLTEQDQSPEIDNAGTEAAGSESDIPDIDIPPPGVISRPVLKRLPPSVPEWQSADPNGIYDDVGIDYGVRPITKLQDIVYLQSFVDDSPDNSEAIVIETQKTGYYGADLESVYAKFPKGKGRLGRQYLVVQPLGKIKPALDSVTTTDLGYQKRISGLVTLQNRIKASVGEEYEVYKAIVDKSVDPVQIGGQLIRGDLPVVNLEESGPVSTMVAMIIGGTGGQRQSVFGKGSIVYLNRGSKEGVGVGQILSVRANRKSRSRDTLILEANRAIGKVKIIKTAARFATAVVLTSSDAILAGDFTGSGPYSERPANQLASNSAGSYDDSADFGGGDEAVGDDELESLLDDAEFGDDTDLGNDSGFDDPDF